MRENTDVDDSDFREVAETLPLLGDVLFVADDNDMLEFTE